MQFMQENSAALHAKKFISRTARRRARHDRQTEDPSSARAEHPHGAVENCRPGTGALRG